MTQRVSFRLNGDAVTTTTDGDRPLLDVLRLTFGLTGSKRGCGVGYCGACTVLVDGEAVPACLRMVALVEGCEVTTVEGLQQGTSLSPIQHAFAEKAGFQCGFCTPGHVVAAHALFARCPDPSDDQLLATVDGNYCRCTGYVKIAESLKYARELASGREQR